MRYPESVMKSAILHSDVSVREFAIRYFAEGSSQDETLIETVIEAIERYGRNGVNAQLLGRAAGLPLTPASIEWMLKELNSDAPPPEELAFSIDRVLRGAEPTSLVSCKDEFLTAKHIPETTTNDLVRRLDMVGWDANTCWNELRLWASNSPEGIGLQGCDLFFGKSAADAWARASIDNPSAVLQALETSDDDKPPMDLLGPMIVRAAGALRLNAAIPKIIANLAKDISDLMNEQCETALARIGSPEVLAAICEHWNGAPNHFCIYATDLLGRFRSDLAVQTILELLQTEKNEDTRAGLIDAMVVQCASEAIEPARRHFSRPRDSIMNNGLRSDLLVFCEITGERFPEYEAMAAAEKSRKETHRRKMEDIGDDPKKFIQYAMERLEKEKPIFDDEGVETLPQRGPAPIVHDSPKVGRNAPCPCGSGKKFKQCCLKKSLR